MRVLNFAMTSATSHSKDDAISKVKAQAAELKTVLSSTLDSEVNTLSGDDLKLCFQWDYLLPDKRASDEFLF